MDGIGEVLLMIILAVAGTIPSLIKAKAKKKLSKGESYMPDTKAEKNNTPLSEVWKSLVGDNDPFDFDNKPQPVEYNESRSDYSTKTGNKVMGRQPHLRGTGVGDSGSTGAEEMGRAGSLEVKYAMDAMRNEEFLEAKYMQERGLNYEYRQHTTPDVHGDYNTKRPSKSTGKNIYDNRSSKYLSSKMAASEKSAINATSTGNNTFMEDFDKSIDNTVMSDFDIRKAIIYYEIMRPKFQE